MSLSTTYMHYYHTKKYGFNPKGLAHDIFKTWSALKNDLNMIFYSEVYSHNSASEKFSTEYCATELQEYNKTYL